VSDCPHDVYVDVKALINTLKGIIEEYQKDNNLTDVLIELHNTAILTPLGNRLEVSIDRYIELGEAKYGKK
jgi:hypothetical protein